jgi:hypothetical protein
MAKKHRKQNGCTVWGGGGRERELLKSNAPSVQKDMHLKGLYIFPPLQF